MIKLNLFMASSMRAHHPFCESAKNPQIRRKHIGHANIFGREPKVNI